MNAPNVATHVAATAELPKEPVDQDHDRPDFPVPSLWQHAVVAIHRHSKKRVIVHRVDHAMNLFRPYFPDETDPRTGVMGRFAAKTEWYSCAKDSDWEPEVTLSKAEIERQAAADEMALTIAAMSDADAAIVNALCDSDDPAKNFAKMQMLVKAGFVKGPSEKAAKK